MRESGVRVSMNGGAIAALGLVLAELCANSGPLRRPLPDQAHHVLFGIH